MKEKQLKSMSMMQSLIHSLRKEVSKTQRGKGHGKKTGTVQINPKALSELLTKVREQAQGSQQGIIKKKAARKFE